MGVSLGEDQAEQLCQAVLFLAALCHPHMSCRTIPLDCFPEKLEKILEKAAKGGGPQKARRTLGTCLLFHGCKNYEASDREPDMACSSRVFWADQGDLTYGNT